MKYEEAQLDIEKFQLDLSIPELKAPPNIQNLLKQVSSFEFISKLGPEDCSSYAIILNAYSLFLTQNENRLKSYLAYCDAALDRIVGENLSQSGEYGYQAKRAEVLAYDQLAKIIVEKKLAAEMKYESVRNLSYKISIMSDQLMNLGKDKRSSGR